MLLFSRLHRSSWKAEADKVSSMESDSDSDERVESDGEGGVRRRKRRRQSLNKVTVKRKAYDKFLYKVFSANTVRPRCDTGGRSGRHVSR